MPQAPKQLAPASAAAILRTRIADPTKPLTVADAAVAGGLAQRDAEAGLTWLTHEYRGHLRVTEDGDLVHVFPHGFTKPWEQKERLAVLGARALAVLVGAGRFLVRAWLLVVMVAYALFFVALAIALLFSGSDERRDGAGSILGGLFRGILDALYWTSRPFSVWSDPAFDAAPGYARRGHRSLDDAEEVPFYEKVNRFVFGPTAPPEDPAARESRLLQAIRAGKGRIGIADVMRVTGLPRAEADPLLARLMLDHEGTVEVSDEGGIVYTFASLRRTAGDTAAPPAPPPAWEKLPSLPPLTGNGAGANVGIALLNLFNLAAGWLALSHHLTFANLGLLFAPRDPDVPFLWPTSGTAVALGLVPFVFSLIVLALPLLRAAFRARTARKVAEERARLGVLREVVTRSAAREPIDDAALRRIVRVATGDEPTSKEITRRVVALGGDVDVGPEGEVRYRFAELEADAAALAEERAAADEGEARLGKVVFASDE